MKQIILIGMKACGKTTVGKLLAKRLQVPFLDSDEVVEKLYQETTGEILSCREIAKKHGTRFFYELDGRSLDYIVATFGKGEFVLACGGGTPLASSNQELLSKLGYVVFLHVGSNILLERITRQGVPAYFPYQDDLKRSLDELLEKRVPIYRNSSRLTVKVTHESPSEVAELIVTHLC